MKCNFVFNQLALLLVLLSTTLCAQNDPELFRLELTAGDFDRENSVVSALIFKTDKNLKSVMLKDEAGTTVVGQIHPVMPPMIANPAQQLVTFIAPKMKAGQKKTYRAFAHNRESGPRFQWHDDQSTQAQLRFGESAVIAYMYEAIDDSTDQRRQETYKPYHHVFSPSGDRMLTKGPGGLFPHHRGIFYGFNRIRYGDKQADTWHCKQQAHQSHVRSLQKSAGPVFGEDVNLIHWHGADGKVFAEEIRRLRAFKIDGNTLIEFTSMLASTIDETIKLDGDPQHAGVQFRATQKVPDQTKAKTYYLRPDGKDSAGNFRNWSNKSDESEINRAHINLPWNTLNFFVDQNQYSCCYIDHPSNPKPARFSERDYGRFGSYFVTEISSEKPLLVQYRFWIQDGELTIDRANQLSQDFIRPISATIAD